jgi:hypothetical protein
VTQTLVKEPPSGVEEEDQPRFWVLEFIINGLFALAM